MSSQKEAPFFDRKKPRIFGKTIRLSYFDINSFSKNFLANLCLKNKTIWLQKIFAIGMSRAKKKPTKITDQCVAFVEGMSLAF